MEYTFNCTSEVAHVTLYGSIRPSSRATFLEIITKLNGSERALWQLDLADISYLDSHGMGLMIELHENAKQNQAQVAIIGANDLIKRMFALSKFDTLFDIQD